MVTEKELIEQFLGIPYKHRGRTQDGLDCWGLIIWAYKKMGYDLWDIEEEYDKNWSFKGRDLFIENYHKEWEKRDKPELFDVVLFLNGKGIANHGGIMLTNGGFLHCCKRGTVRSRLSQWRQKPEGFYHLKIRK